MSMYWMIAEAQAPSGSQDGTVVTMEQAAPAGEAPATTTTTQTDGTAAPTQPVKPQNVWPQVLLMVFLFVLMYFMLFRAPKKRQQEQQKMVASLKKNDRVRTIGGVFGTIIDVRDDEIVLKIDEANNTKIRIIPSAIAQVLSDEKKNQ
ncbi:MAG: preprotein translocase subunit YajC [Anaerohalosphaeraceae bacterium]